MWQGTSEAHVLCPLQPKTRAKQIKVMAVHISYFGCCIYTMIISAFHCLTIFCRFQRQGQMAGYTQGNDTYRKCVQHTRTVTSAEGRIQSDARPNTVGRHGYR